MSMCVSMCVYVLSLFKEFSCHTSKSMSYVQVHVSYFNLYEIDMHSDE